MAGTAWACVWGTPPAGSTGCDEVQASNFEYSLDNGATWQQIGVKGTTINNVGVQNEFSSVEVKVSGDIKGCSLPVSLATYSTQGSTWQTSGTQTLVGFATETLSSSQTTVTLTAKAPNSCYEQDDLYFGDTEYDGGTGTGHGPAPHYPDSTVPKSNELVAHWNGQNASDCATSTPTQSPTQSTSPSSSPTASSTTPAGNSISPIATSTTPGGTLAHTGSDNTPLVLGGAALLLVLGAGGFFGSRKLAARRTH
jgi:LPXTG-motif cell wall-anchored protein